MTLLRCLILVLGAWLAMVQTAPAASSPAAVLSLIGQAEQAVAAGDDRGAEALLSRIPGRSVDGVQLARLQLVRAEIGRIRRQPDTMLRSLPPTSDHVPALAARIEGMRGEAHFMAGDAVQAVRALVMRERWLRAPSDLADNRERIWSGLIATPLGPGAAAEILGQPPMVRGWLDFAQVLQQGASAAAVTDWSQRHPGHPAQARIAAVSPGSASARAGQRRTTLDPGLDPGPGPGPGASYQGLAAGGRIAVLLPLSGHLSSGGNALRDGLVAAWYSAPSPRPVLHFHDTRGDAGAALVAWETAVRDGATLIIGPLTKAGVAIIARQGTPRPWVALNYLDEPVSGALQFGLAPEDEARAAALDGLAKGRRQAVALVPDNDWGARTLRAFEETYTSQGGRLLDSVSIQAGTQDFGDAMRDLLKLEDSRSRHRQLTQVLGTSSEFEPRPRQDADLLFAPLRADEIRALAPQLGFFRAGRLSTYVISAAHGGQVDQQLEGLTLCDMPWVMSGSGRVDEQRARDALNFPLPVRNQPRLFALGRDAFDLARALAGGTLHHLQNHPGATGRLQVTPGGRVLRTLECHRVVDGRARAGA